VINEFLTKLREAGFLVFGHTDDVAIVARRYILSIHKERRDDYRIGTDIRTN